VRVGRSAKGKYDVKLQFPEEWGFRPKQLSIGKEGIIIFGKNLSIGFHSFDLISVLKVLANHGMHKIQTDCNLSNLVGRVSHLNAP